jgi:hypothetical protein
MRNLLAAFAAVFLCAVPTAAGTLSVADQVALSGEWHADGTASPCKPGEDAPMKMTIEFAATGGTLALDDGSEAAGNYAIKSAQSGKDGVIFDLGANGTLRFNRIGGKLKALNSATGVADFTGEVFGRCFPPADRGAMKLQKADLQYLSSGMPPDAPIFIDSRAPKACKAIEYQYLAIDLVGPIRFTMGRANSFAVGEKLADGKKVSLARDEISNWRLEKAIAAPGGYELTVTELIPPSFSRGDTTTIFLKKTAKGFDIPAWKRSYVRCAKDSLAAE